MLVGMKTSSISVEVNIDISLKIRDTEAGMVAHALLQLLRTQKQADL